MKNVPEGKRPSTSSFLTVPSLVKRNSSSSPKESFSSVRLAQSSTFSFEITILNILQGSATLCWEERVVFVERLQKLSSKAKQDLANFIEEEKGAAESAIENNACKEYRCSPQDLNEAFKREGGVTQLIYLWDTLLTEILPSLESLLYPLIETCPYFDIRRTVLRCFRDRVLNRLLQSATTRIPRIEHIFYTILFETHDNSLEFTRFEQIMERINQAARESKKCFASGVCGGLGGLPGLGFPPPPCFSPIPAVAAGCAAGGACGPGYACGAYGCYSIRRARAHSAQTLTASAFQSPLSTRVEEETSSFFGHGRYNQFRKESLPLPSDPNAAFMACCESRGLPDACLRHCTFNTFTKETLTRMYFKQDLCPLQASAEIQFCAAQGRDHRACCARNGVTTTMSGENEYLNEKKYRCLTFCDQRPGNVTLLDMSYIGCYDRFENMKSCFWHDISQRMLARF